LTLEYSMRARGTIAARIKAAQKHHVAQAKGLERRRGLISFLTWAFFLADMLGRDGISPSAAHASAADEPAPPHGSPDITPPPSELSDRPPTSMGDPGEPVTIVSPGYTLSLAPVASEAGALDAGGAGGSDGPAYRATPIETGGTATGGGVETGAVASFSPEPPPDGPPPDGAQGEDAPPLLTIAPDGLLHGVVDTLGAVPIVGDLLSATAHTVASTVGSLVDGLGGILLPLAGPPALLRMPCSRRMVRSPLMPARPTFP
jgi:hypothetical protein